MFTNVFIRKKILTSHLTNLQYFTLTSYNSFSISFYCETNTQALVNFDSILAASDGIMVARGDLGVEIPMETLCNVQKDLVRRSNIAGKESLQHEISVVLRKRE